MKKTRTVSITYDAVFILLGSYVFDHTLTIFLTEYTALSDEARGAKRIVCSNKQ